MGWLTAPPAWPQGRKGGNLPALYGAWRWPSGSGGDAIPLAGGSRACTTCLVLASRGGSSRHPSCSTRLVCSPTGSLLSRSRRLLGPKLRNGGPNSNRWVRGRNIEWGVWGWADCSRHLHCLNNCLGKDALLYIALQHTGRKWWCFPLWKVKAVLIAPLGLPLLKKESQLLI